MECYFIIELDESEVSFVTNALHAKTYKGIRYDIIKIIYNDKLPDLSSVSISIYEGKENEKSDGNDNEKKGGDDKKIGISKRSSWFFVVLIILILLIIKIIKR